MELQAGIPAKKGNNRVLTGTAAVGSIALINPPLLVSSSVAMFRARTCGGGNNAIRSRRTEARRDRSTSDRA
jgi:hypothetical protein